MRRQRYFRVLWRLRWLPVVLAACGALVQFLWIQAQPTKYVAIGKMIPDVRWVPDEAWANPRTKLNADAELKGIHSAHLKRQALERVRTLHPELREADVNLDVVFTKGSGIARVIGSGAEIQFTKAYVDAFLEEAVTSSGQKFGAAMRAVDEMRKEARLREEQCDRQKVQLAALRLKKDPGVSSAEMQLARDSADCEEWKKKAEEAWSNAWIEAPLNWAIRERPTGAYLDKPPLMQTCGKWAAAGLGLGVILALACAVGAAMNVSRPKLSPSAAA